MSYIPFWTNKSKKAPESSLEQPNVNYVKSLVPKLIKSQWGANSSAVKHILGISSIDPTFQSRS